MGRHSNDVLQGALRKLEEGQFTALQRYARSFASCLALTRFVIITLVKALLFLLIKERPHGSRNLVSVNMGRCIWQVRAVKRPG
jgi:hypothetical protein